ncbi:MAG: FeoB-associated Cys-rich membrane protein [Clostridia bacterium]|nr:FeoB-associated Cys-rich membrane protein [Clostridia bacterium]
MNACDIIVTVVLSLAVVAVIAIGIYKKVKHKGGCCDCGCNGCTACDKCKKEEK